MLYLFISTRTGYQLYYNLFFFHVIHSFKFLSIAVSSRTIFETELVAPFVHHMNWTGLYCWIDAFLCFLFLLVFIFGGLCCVALYNCLQIFHLSYNLASLCVSLSIYLTLSPHFVFLSVSFSFNYFNYSFPLLVYLLIDQMLFDLLALMFNFYRFVQAFD